MSEVSRSQFRRGNKQINFATLGAPFGESAQMKIARLAYYVYFVCKWHVRREKSWSATKKSGPEAWTKVWRNANARWLNCSLSKGLPVMCARTKRWRVTAVANFWRDRVSAQPLSRDRKIANSNSPRAARRSRGKRLHRHHGNNQMRSSTHTQAETLILRIVNETDLVGNHNKDF